MSRCGQHRRSARRAGAERPVPAGGRGQGLRTSHILWAATTRI